MFPLILSQQLQSVKKILFLWDATANAAEAPKGGFSFSFLFFLRFI